MGMELSTSQHQSARFCGIDARTLIELCLRPDMQHLDPLPAFRRAPCRHSQYCVTIDWAVGVRQQQQLQQPITVFSYCREGERCWWVIRRGRLHRLYTKVIRIYAHITQNRNPFGRTSFHSYLLEASVRRAPAEVVLATIGDVLNNKYINLWS